MIAFSIFLAVFLAVYFAHGIERFRNERERNRIYCRKKALYYRWLWRTSVLAKQNSLEEYAKEAKWWEQQAKSWIAAHPDQDEQDMEFEEPLDAQIQQAIKDFKNWEARDEEV